MSPDISSAIMSSVIGSSGMASGSTPGAGSMASMPVAGMSVAGMSTGGTGAETVCAVRISWNCQDGPSVSMPGMSSLVVTVTYAFSLCESSNHVPSTVIVST